MKLPVKCPIAMSEMTMKQFNAELLKGMEDIENERVISADDIEAQIRRKYSDYGKRHIIRRS